jgi:drug/metabolite transporter (DMT)-like permease
MSVSDERLTLAIFLVASVLAGGNAVGVRFSNRELDPLWGAGLRFSLAAVVLLVIMAAMGLAIPRGRELAGSAVYGLFSFGGAFALAYYGLQRVPAGIGQTLLAIVPLATLLLAFMQRQERIDGAGVAGSLLAIGGMAVVTGAAADTVPLLSVLAIVGSALCFAQAAVIAHRLPSVHPVTLNAVGMTCGSIFLLIAALIAGNSFALPEKTATWVALAFLVLVGSVIVFGMYAYVLQHWEASRASYTFVLVPVFTVIFSAWLDDEKIGAGLVAGGLLVFAGVYLGALRPGHAGRRRTLHRPH